MSPRPDLAGDPDAIARLTFAGTEDPAQPTEAPDLAMPLAESPRLAEIAKRSRSGLGANGERLPASAAVTLRLALGEAIAEAAARDPELVIYGQEARDWEGAFGVYRGLTELLPYHRLFNAPISEAAIVGTAVGYAMEGGRALVELMYADFIGRAGDELLNQLAKWRAMSGGTLRLPVVVRVSVGNRYGAQHSQDWSGLVAGVPGLKVVYPATPYDAKGLLASALAGADPVVFFEAQSLYDTTELWHEGGVPRDPYRIPIGVPDTKRPGRDLTVVAVGPGAPSRAGRRRAAAERVGHRGGGHRRALAGAVRPRARPGLGAPDEPAALRLGRGVPREPLQRDRGLDRAPGAWRARCAGGGHGRAGPHHPTRGAGRLSTSRRSRTSWPWCTRS